MKHLYALLLTVLFLCLLAGCSNQTISNDVPRAEDQEITDDQTENSNKQSGYLKGRVIIGPVCPAEALGENCEADPSAYQAIVLGVYTGFGASRGPIREFSPGGQGNFEIELGTGSYTLKLISAGGGFSKDLPQLVDIRPDKTTDITINIDTGIRGGAEGTPIDPDSDIYQCDKDDDCVLVLTGGCCGYTAVNRQHQDKIQAVPEICDLLCRQTAACKGNICIVESGD